MHIYDKTVVSHDRNLSFSSYHVQERVLCEHDKLLDYMGKYYKIKIAFIIAKVEENLNSAAIQVTNLHLFLSGKSHDMS